jgi:hypothetical protein
MVASSPGVAWMIAGIPPLSSYSLGLGLRPLLGARRGWTPLNIDRDTFAVHYLRCASASSGSDSILDSQRKLVSLPMAAHYGCTYFYLYFWYMQVSCWDLSADVILFIGLGSC